MRIKMTTVTCVAAVLACASVAEAQPAKVPPTALSAPTKADVIADVNATFGFVPEFIRAIPDSFLVGFWMTMKTFEMNPQTSLNAKSKELIGIAVASQIPCEYCVYFHTLAARHAGATDQEIKEAVGMAAMTRMGSTVLNGLQLDKAQFRKDIDRVMRVEGKPKAQARRNP